MLFPVLASARCGVFANKTFDVYSYAHIQLCKNTNINLLLQVKFKFHLSSFARDRQSMRVYKAFNMENIQHWLFIMLLATINTGILIEFSPRFT